MNYQTPAVRVLFLFIGGIVLAEKLPVPFSYAFFASLAFCGVVIVLLLVRQRLVFSIALQFLFLVVAYTVHVGNEERTLSYRLLPFQKDEAIRVYGSVAIKPRYSERSVRFLVSVDSVERIGWFGGNPRTLIVYCQRGCIDSFLLRRNAFISVTGIIKEYPARRNPAEFDYGKYLQLQNIDGIVAAEKVVVLPQNDGGTFWERISALQEHFYTIFDSLHTERVAGFLKSLVLGNREDLADDIKDSFVTTGTIHILAVSGTHVGVVALIFYVFFTALRIPRKAVALLSIVALFLYMFITGMSPSVVRATIMASLFLLGKCFERPTNIYNSIAIAALILLIADTRTLFSVGAQLSFAAVLSIVFFYPRLTSFVNRWTWDVAIANGVKGLYKLFALSFAAQIGTIPFTAYYFGKVSLIAFVVNLVVVPLAGLTIILGFVELFFAHLNMVVAGYYAAVTEIVVTVLFVIVEKAARIPFASVSIPLLAPVEVVLYFFIIIGFAMPKKILKYTLFVILVYLNGNVYSSLLREETQKLSTLFFDVGQGDACLITFPAGRYVLIDTGPRTGNSDAGKRILVPYFQQHGISRLQYVVLTHPHDDHYGGVLSVAGAIRIDTLVIPKLIEYPESFERLLAEIQKKGTAIKYATMRIQLYPHQSVRLYILHPQKEGSKEKNLNNTSLVLKLLYGQETALFMADAEKEVEHELLVRYGDFLQASLVKVGHHGSNTSSSEEFIATVHPHIAIISVGEKNKFGHPSEAVIKRYEEHRTTVYRTDVSHAIVFENTGNEWAIAPWKE